MGSLHGLKSAGAAFRNHLADCMRTLGYKPCLADPDLWYKPMVRPEDGHKYYAYMLLYVDDCLSIYHNAHGQLEQLDWYFKMKPGSIGDPDVYFGAKLRKMTLANVVESWGMSPSKYVQEAVRNIEAYLRDNMSGRKLGKCRGSAQFPPGYTPELDVMPQLRRTLAAYYQSQIGILRWMVELGCVDIITELSLLLSHMALPREGHSDTVFHMYSHLKANHNS